MEDTGYLPALEDLRSLAAILREHVSVLYFANHLPPATIPYLVLSVRERTALKMRKVM